MGLIDAHSHILWGIDDGPETLEESLEMCEQYAFEGVDAVVATPHSCDGRFDASAESIHRGVERLSTACEQRGIRLEILIGSEVRVSPELLRSLDEGEAVTIGGAGRYVLLELPPNIAPQMAGLDFELSVRGITPILAHPERNFEMQRRPERLVELVERGWLVQVTGLSLLGGFGPGAKAAAEWFVQTGLAHIVASDAHSSDGRRPELRRAYEAVTALTGTEEAVSLLVTNPERVIRGEKVETSSGRHEAWEVSVTGVSAEGSYKEMERS